MGMTFKGELKALVEAHLPPNLWIDVKRAKYFLRFPFQLTKFDLKMIRRIRTTHGVSRFYIRKRKNETVLMFIFSERFFRTCLNFNEGWDGLDDRL